MPADHFSLEAVIRPNILALHPYRCARDDYQSGILLDANENSYGHSIVTSKTNTNGIATDVSNDNEEVNTFLAEHLRTPLHRYPDPSHPLIKSKYAKLRNVPSLENVFLGVGSDEVIDLLFRVACVPGKDKALICPPTYGMYAVCAQINDIGVVKVPQDTTGGRFSVQADKVLEATAADPTIKLVFLCSPGNPTATAVPLSVTKKILDSPSFKGLVIVDEAYIDFAQASHPDTPMSATTLLSEYPNLVVLQTMSKGFGLAAIRLGFAFTSPALNQILSNTKAPYNISAPTAGLAMQALTEESLGAMKEKVASILKGRKYLLEAFSEMKQDLGPYVGGLDANFIMVPVLNRQTGQPDNVRAEKVYQVMAESQGVVVRFRGKELGCTACLRVTVGTDEENETLIQRLKIVGGTLTILRLTPTPITHCEDATSVRGEGGSIATLPQEETLLKRGCRLHVAFLSYRLSLRESQQLVAGYYGAPQPNVWMGCGPCEAGILAAALQFDIEMRHSLIHDSKALRASHKTFSISWS